MPNYNQTLQTNNSSLEEIITQLNNMPDAGGSGTPVEQAIPTITVNSSTGLITATATQAEGYVAAGTKSATKQLAFQAAQTITPGTTNKTIPANTYLGGVQTIKGDVNLVASNIVSGKSIFGVVGTATAGGGGGGDTSLEDSLITRTVTSYTNDRVTKIGSYAFLYCSSLTTVSFPQCATIGSYAFDSCSKLTTVSFPQCKTIGSHAFWGCSSLTTVSFPQCKTIGNYAFWDCSSLTKLYLAGSSLCSLANSEAFAYTGITSTTGSIFVPVSRVASYKAATNWAYFSNRIFAYN